ncbi:ribonuclease HI [Sandaracinus amylolyticus]|uniref:ribonuclease HI n=1 Tax=Sandaracinus amylolyticus TaxID=927083 RepID=UPI001F23C83A|nr:ribonuclease H [Sandaracinus amylolyticus]
MPWTTMRLRGQKVLVRCDEAGTPQAESGRVEIRYKPNDGRAYRALPANLEAIADAEVLPDDHCAPAEDAPKSGAAATTTKTSSAKSGGASKAGPRKTAAIAAGEQKARDGAVVAYADGACSGNPGPAGLGVVIDDDGTRRELSEYLGQATNNVAELTAILRVAERYQGDARPIEIRTDSQYSIGVLAKGWKAKANTDLVAQVKKALAGVPEVHLIYVPGHSGFAGNERADELARDAVSGRRSSGWMEKKRA